MKGLRPAASGHNSRQTARLETNDLICEGIATTFVLLYVKSHLTLETNDLICEGIATSHCSEQFYLLFLLCKETNDLICEGIATALR